MNYYSTVNNNGLCIHAKAWIKIQGIMLSEKNPTLKVHILYDFIYITILKIKKNYRDG